MRKKLFHFILNDPVLRFSQTGYQTEGIGSLDVLKIVFDSEIFTPWLLGNESQSKMLINLHSSQTKAATNSFMYVDTIMNFGGILDGFWPINNKTKCLLCDVRCKSKDGVTKFFTRLHYSIYKQSQVEDVLLRVTHHCIL